jgi:2-methylcitrate dehydratase PrpD
VRVAAGSARHERTVTHVPGDPARAFDRARVHEKFLRFVRPALGAEAAERMLARCHAAPSTGEFTPLVQEIERACLLTC